MLRDLSVSDSTHLSSIVQKIKNMAHEAPSLVLETIHDYFVNNPKVGAARPLEEAGGRGGLGPKAGSNLGSST